MRIGFDVSGGDFAPKVNLDGLKLAIKELPSSTFFLFGDKEEISTHPSFLEMDKKQKISSGKLLMMI